MADTVYNRFKGRSARGDAQWGPGAPTPGDFRMLFLETTAAGAFNPDLDSVADLLAVGSVAEMIATNYARQALTEVDPTFNDTNDRTELDASDVTISNLGVAAGTDGSVVAVVIYQEGASDAARFLVSYHDSNFPVVTNGQNFTVAIADALRLT